MLLDLRYALRTLRHSPGFALIAILSLALGIGANSAMFSLANAIILRPMPVPNASQLIAVQSQFRGESLGRLFQYSGLSYPDYTDLRDRGKSFDGLAASEYSPFGFATGKSALPRMKFGQLVSGNFFRVMDVPPILGRNFRPDEDQVKGRDAVVILGYDLWKTEFASNPDAIGRAVFLNGIAFRVIGVTPESFTGSQLLIRSSLYVPLAMESSLAGSLQQDHPRPGPLDDRAQRSLTVQGRLKSGVSVAQAKAEAGVIAQQLALAYPDTNRTCLLVVDTDLRARLIQNPYALMVVLLLVGLAGVVLLIACANVANLMLSRASARSREIAVRLAIGASRGRLVRQLLTESLLIALLSGALGLLVAQTGADMFSQFRIPADVPVSLDVKLDPQVLLFALCVSVASALLFGLVPALQCTRPDLVPALKSGKAEGGKRRRFLGRNTLVVAQVAGALLLLVAATQAYRGALVLLASPAGFRTDHLLTASFNPALARYTPDQAQEFYKDLLDKARALNGVNSAALSQAVPIVPAGNLFTRLVPEGVQLAPGTDAISVVSNTVSEGYFGTVGLPIVDGREFQATDRPDASRVAIVNELFARKYYPNRSAIGRRFRLDGAGGPAVEIVGVAKQSKYFFLTEPPFEYIYLPLSQNPRPGMTILLHTAAPSGVVAGPLRDLVRSIDAGQPVISVRTMEEIFDSRTASLRLMIDAIGWMGLLGLGMALVGLYGIVSYSVSLRAREIGIRMAIGADRAVVLGMVLKQGMVLAASGVVLGLLLCLIASRAVTAALGVPAFNLALLAWVAAGLVSVAVLGAYVPARRAALMDPNSVLRQE
ncbi:MAG TPA: ABC transporter permease [Candidatus Acidoferrales bacterium]|nr:ABC transporter permease [Candidatus Acidoferrales bacterium]